MPRGATAGRRHLVIGQAGRDGERVPNPEATLKTAKMTGNVFQRLDVETISRNPLGVDLLRALGTAWSTLTEAMAARRVITHCSGIVDQKYQDRVPGSTLRIGRRITINVALVNSLLDTAAALGALLVPTQALRTRQPRSTTLGDLICSTARFTYQGVVARVARRVLTRRPSPSRRWTG